MLLGRSLCLLQPVLRPQNYRHKDQYNPCLMLLNHHQPHQETAQHQAARPIQRYRQD